MQNCVDMWWTCIGVLTDINNAQYVGVICTCGYVRHILSACVLTVLSCKHADEMWISGENCPVNTSHHSDSSSG